MGRGLVFVVSAPSGAGKSTLLSIARKRLPDLAVTVSATTRQPRPGEKDGVDYYFLSREEFREAIAQNAFAEWAEVHGQFYGTFKSEIERHIGRGGTIVLELDVQGMQSIKSLYPDMVSIFIVPPSLEELKCRLISRGTNEEEDIRLRLANATREMEAQSEFDHIIVNDDVENTATQLVALFQTSPQAS